MFINVNIRNKIQNTRNAVSASSTSAYNPLVVCVNGDGNVPYSTITDSGKLDITEILWMQNTDATVNVSLKSSSGVCVCIYTYVHTILPKVFT